MKRFFVRCLALVLVLAAFTSPVLALADTELQMVDTKLLNSASELGKDWNFSDGNREYFAIIALLDLLSDEEWKDEIQTQLTETAKNNTLYFAVQGDYYDLLMFGEDDVMMFLYDQDSGIGVFQFLDVDLSLFEPDLYMAKVKSDGVFEEYHQVDIYSMYARLNELQND